MTNCPKSKCPNNIQPKYDKMPRVIKRPKDIMPMMTICPKSHFAQGDKMPKLSQHSIPILIYIFLNFLFIFLISNKKNYAQDFNIFKLGIISPIYTQGHKKPKIFYYVFFKSIMPNIKHNIKIICEIHIAYRYIDPSCSHNFENCLLP